MSGHNKWAQIKHQKSITDKKRGVVFSKILKAIAIAARQEVNPQFNPRLRNLIEKAREHNIPQKNIERALHKSTDTDQLEELTIEAYGPAGSAILIQCVTDNRNRTTAEIKHLLQEHGAKMAEIGSVRWAFDNDISKFPQTVTPADEEKINTLVVIIEQRDDVQRVITNIKITHEDPRH